MKRQDFKVIALLLTLMLLTLSLVGCGGEEEPSKKTAETSTVVKVADAEIILGVTKLSELTAQGYSLFSNASLSEPVSADEVMPARTYDIGIYFSKDNVIYGTVQCLNEKEEEIPYLESIINQVEVNYLPNPYASAITPGYYNESILIDGVDFKGMTPDQLLEAIKDTIDEEATTIDFPDKSIAFVTFSRNDCYLQFGFDMETQVLSTAELEMFHTQFE